MQPTDLPTDYLQQDMTRWRHEFHQRPELGFAEENTADRIATLLEGFGVEVHRNIGQTGVVGVLQKGNGTASIGLRADMDALPISEKNDFSYRSTTPDIMHACGHDGHMAMLLGAAKHLAGEVNFSGRVVFIFQPNEENGLGAEAMIRAGLFDHFQVDQVFGMHNIPGMPLGHFATRPGPITASESLFEITLQARGGHAALPHMGVDAILVGSEIVTALQSIVARKLDPSQNGVVSITEFIGDGGRNILPGNVVLKGDARALTPEINDIIEKRMRQIVQGICLAHDITGTVSYRRIFPATINSAEPTRAAVTAGTALVGAAQIEPACPPKLFSEDFAHMATPRPACFMLMGNGTDGSHAQPLHAADYDFNDLALGYGSSFWVQLVQQQLAPESGTV